MPRRQLEKVLVAELGDSWKEKVADFEYDPIAAASIGQVSRQLLTVNSFMSSQTGTMTQFTGTAQVVRVGTMPIRHTCLSGCRLPCSFL